MDLLRRRGGANAETSQGPALGPAWSDPDGEVTVKGSGRISLAGLYTLPPYAPELNPVEKVWSHLKRSLANLAASTVTNLARLAKTRLKKMQYTNGLIDGFFKATGLSPP